MRRHERVVVEAAVTMESDHNFYAGFAENISTGGLFVATHDILPLGARFTMVFTVPTYDREVRVTCEVRWQRLHNPFDAETISGMGVQFVDLGPIEERAINAFIRARETIFYDD